jgi:rhodanese-related sulfurtransferase
MKNIFFASLFTLAISLVSCAQGNKETNLLSTLPANAFQIAIQKPNVQILDVRSAGEFAGGRIKNALQANWNDPKEFESRTQELDKKATVYVYCQVGGRSAAAQDYLMEKGFNVVNLEGGLSSWKMNGLPVEGNSNVQQMAVSDFEKVIASNNLVLVDIGASWCPPCRKMQPTLDQVKKEQGTKLYFLAVDGGVDMDVMKQVNFEALPTYIIYKNGKEVWRKAGIVAAAEFTKALQ